METSRHMRELLMAIPTVHSTVMGEGEARLLKGIFSMHISSRLEN